MDTSLRPKVCFAVSGSLAGLPVEGLRVVVLDIPFALPVAPADHSLFHPETLKFYQAEFETQTLAFIRRLDIQLVLWVDHHDHANWPMFQKDPRFLLVSQNMAPAAAVLINENLFQTPQATAVDTIIAHGDFDGLISTARFILQGALPYPQALQDAVVADTRQGEMSKTGVLIETAIKARSVDATCQAALSWLLDQNPASMSVLQAAASEYQTPTHGTFQYHDIGICRIMDARRILKPGDPTETLLDLQKDGHVSMLIQRKDGRHILWIASSVPALNLPHLLGLPGGSTQRVLLDAGHLEEAVTLINESYGQGYHLLPPREATIEITRRCNLHCQLCPVGIGTARTMPDMDFAHFSHIIDLIGGTLERLCLHNYGEPCLHPSLPRFIRYAKLAGIPHIFFATNGNYLPSWLARELVESGLDCIRFSVDTSDHVAYAQYRTGGSLAAVLANMQQLRQIRADLGSRTPIVEAQALLMRQNESFAANFEKVMLEHGADSVRFKTVNIYMPGEEHIDRASGYLPEELAFSRYVDPSQDLTTPDEQYKPCSLPTESLVILADGTIVPCCHDVNGAHPLGRVSKGSELSSLWDTPARRSFILRRIQQPSTIPMCRRCSLAIPGMDTHKLVRPAAQRVEG